MTAVTSAKITSKVQFIQQENMLGWLRDSGFLILVEIAISHLKYKMLETADLLYLAGNYFFFLLRSFGA